jgi:hypothetical protein
MNSKSYKIYKIIRQERYRKPSYSVPWGISGLDIVDTL